MLHRAPLGESVVLFRHVALLLLVGLPVTGPAAAQTGHTGQVAKTGADWKPEFIEQVPKDKLKAAFPKGATATGRAVLSCAATEDGRLADCRVMHEDPAGQGFGQAALSVVGYERIKKKDAAGASVAGRPVLTRFEFLAPGDSNPNWIRQPSGAEMANVFPKAAIDKRVGGRAVITCQVTIEGFLEACKVRSETPEGLNFGKAGLQLAPQFRLSPKIRGGKAVPGGEVSIPIVWSEPPPGAMIYGSTLVMDPPWSRVPTQGEIDAVWPAAALGQPSGQAALRCRLLGSGQLSSCEVISENPRGKGFGKAAMTLSKLFQANIGETPNKTLKDAKIDVPFRFRDPAAPEARKLTKPRWTRTLSPEGMTALYPDVALKAGVKAGLGVAACTITAAGELSGCAIARETPKALGFGAAAVQAASLMRMNPWTKEGDTVDGLAVTIPFEFTWSGPMPGDPDKAPPAGQ
ncbi:hypothetical protein E1H18_1002 [Caulobacter sp. RHG1]|nr:hypothetical protein [Caulobacter sp. RHG1]